MSHEPGDCCPECKDGIKKDRAALMEHARQKGASKVIDWDLHFVIEGKKGHSYTIKRPSEYLWRAEKFVAVDTAGSCATKLVALRFGKEQVNIPDGGWLTQAFDPNSLSCGLRWPAVQAGESVEVSVAFSEDCRWEARLYGKAVR